MKIGFNSYQSVSEVLMSWKDFMYWWATWQLGGGKSLLVSTQLVGGIAVWSESVRLHKSISYCWLVCGLP